MTYISLVLFTKGDGARLSDQSAFDIAKHCPNLIKLKLESCTAVTNEGIEAVLECCPGLQYLEVGQPPRSRSPQYIRNHGISWYTLLRILACTGY